VVGCKGGVMLWGELWVVAGLCVGKERSLGAASFGRKFRSCQTCTGVVDRLINFLSTGRSVTVDIDGQ